MPAPPQWDAQHALAIAKIPICNRRKRRFPRLLTVNEIAGALRLSPSATYRAIEAGEIQAMRVASRPGASLR